MRVKELCDRVCVKELCVCVLCMKALCVEVCKCVFKFLCERMMFNRDVCSRLCVKEVCVEVCVFASMPPSATPASKTKVHVAKCHACHVKAR